MTELDGAKRALIDEDSGSPKVEALIEAMFLAATSDGEFAKEERSQFAATVEALTERKLSREAMALRADSLVAQLRSDGRRARLAAIAARLPAGKGRETAVMLAAAITASDGVVLGAENDYLADLADALGIEPGRAVDLISRAQAGKPRRPAARVQAAATARAVAPSSSGMPSSVRAAAMIWTVVGALGVLGDGYLLSRGAANGFVLAAFGASALFLLIGIGTNLGVPSRVRGAGVASLLVGALALVGLAVDPGGATGRGASRDGVPLPALLVGLAITGALVGAGAFAIAGNERFEAWRSSSRTGD